TQPHDLGRVHTESVGEVVQVPGRRTIGGGDSAAQVRGLHVGERDTEHGPATETNRHLDPVREHVHVRVTVVQGDPGAALLGRVHVLGGVLCHCVIGAVVAGGVGVPAVRDPGGSASGAHGVPLARAVVLGRVRLGDRVAIGSGLHLTDI